MTPKIVLNIGVTEFHEFVTKAKPAPTDNGLACDVCKRTHAYLKRVANREMKKAGWK